MSDLEALLSGASVAAATIPQYSVRPQQLAMANAVEAAIAEHSNLIVEAGTGTGKTLAYLLPTLASGKRVIVSTGTRQLQDQLIRAEVPTALKILSLRVRVAVLKGRRNYVCPHRLEISLRLGQEPELQMLLQKLQAWQSRTNTGDLGEIVALEEHNRLLPLVTSTADACLGVRCAHFDACPVYRARALAEEADLIIVNHHLLFADLALKEDTMGQVLPLADVIVVDECHQLSNLLPAFFGSSIASRQLVDAARDTVRAMRMIGETDGMTLGLAARLESAVGALGLRLAEATEMPAAALLAREDVRALVRTVDGELAELADLLSLHRDRSLDLHRCYERVLRMVDSFAGLSEPLESPDEIQWLERMDHGFVMRVTPLTFAPDFCRWLEISKAAWVFASATVTVGGDFGFFKQELGLGEVPAMRFDSPFQYAEQVAMLVPAELPVPADHGHTDALIDYCLPLLEANPGRSFFLVTSYAAMAVVARRLAAANVGTVCIQGAMPRADLLAKYRSSDRAILVATHSFWEGVDVRGSDLRLLVIDKLPFLSPTDPLLQTRERALRRAGAHAFTQYALPRAAITLRQGFGRLIRDETDEGLFVLGDVRVFSRDYGAVFLESLPQMPVWRSRQQGVAFLESLS